MTGNEIITGDVTGNAAFPFKAVLPVCPRAEHPALELSTTQCLSQTFSKAVGAVSLALG